MDKGNDELVKVRQLPYEAITLPLIVNLCRRPNTCPPSESLSSASSMQQVRCCSSSTTSCRGASGGQRVHASAPNVYTRVPQTCTHSQARSWSRAPTWVPPAGALPRQRQGRWWCSTTFYHIIITRASAMITRAVSSVITTATAVIITTGYHMLSSPRPLTGVTGRSAPPPCQLCFT
jgi:hypothetical protein